MFLKNVKYLDENFVLQTGDLEIEEGRIRQIAPSLPYTDRDMVVDCEGYTAVPGFVDMHIHGCGGADASDGDKEGVLEMAKFLISHGVTTFCPTTMSLFQKDIEAAITSIAQAKKEQTEGARIAGINFEGPFISRERKGAQLEEAIIDPDFEKFKYYYDLCGGIIKIVDIAPEKPGGDEFVQNAKDFVTVSIAHTTAGYDEAKEAFSRGVTHATHMFNAMAGLHHRNPGVVGAVMDTETVKAELVCDGHHIHPAVVRTVFRLMGDRLIVISDAMRLCGLNEGEGGDLGGQRVTVKNGTATLEDGTIAGSVTNLHEELKNLVSWGVPFPQAVKAMTLNPARAIHMDDRIGSIQVGKKADLVILDEKLEIAAVYH